MLVSFDDDDKWDRIFSKVKADEEEDKAYQRAKLNIKIDAALIAHDREWFMELTSEKKARG